MTGNEMARQVSDESVSCLRQALLQWDSKHFVSFPWREERDCFHALVAEILLQRTKAEQVVPVFVDFKARFPLPGDLAAATTQDVVELIRPLGLHWRADLLVKLGRTIVANGNTVPDDLDRLLCLPGVGPYAASAYLSLHRRQRMAIVDANIVRFYGRYFGFAVGPETRRSRSVRDLAERLTPPVGFRRFNYALIDFTRGVCMRYPNHAACPVSSRCSHFHQEQGGTTW